MNARQIREAVAARLVVAAGATWREAYSSGESVAWPIYLSRMPSQPDECLVITIYPLPIEHRTGVQVRVRGSSSSTTSAEDQADIVRAALHGYAVGDLVQLTWTSGARLGADSQARDEVALNFEATTSDPGVSLVDVTP